MRRRDIGDRATQKNPVQPADKSPQESSSDNLSPSMNLTPAALDFAGRFSKIPEPGRSALALLYINHLSVQEIAQILQLSLEELAEATGAARSILQQSEKARQTAPAPSEGGQP